ncbi:hypothetical protein [Primorskyibacter sp. S187A]
MQTLTYSARGLRLLAHLNADRILMCAALGGALLLGTYLGQLLIS